MSTHLLAGDQVLKLSSARIAKDDVFAVRSAGDLLEQAKKTHEKSEADAQSARNEGYRSGQSQAFEEMRDALISAISELSDGFAAENTRREDNVAKAAMAVVEKLIDATPDAELVRGLAARALSQCGPESEAIRVFVAPQWADDLDQAFAKNPCVEVAGDPSLDRFACRVISGDGRIIADLDKQLASLRERWGLADE